jgi:DNA-binding transcriptional LysR family regulator
MFLKDLSEYSIQSLRIFAYVASMGSVAEAADALRLSQPAVSLQISNLEKHLGFPLFERSGRRNVLTVRGQELYQKLLPMLEQLEQLLVDIREEENVTRPKLFMGSVEGVGEYWFSRHFHEFLQEHEGARLFLDIGDNDALEERLMTGRVNLVVTTKKVEYPGVISVVLMDEKLVPVGTKKIVKKFQETLEKSKKGERYWEQISWIGYGDSYSTETWAQRWLESIGTTIDRRFKYRHQANSYAVIRHLLLDEVGLCVAPKHTVEEEIKSGKLAALESRKYPALENRLYISWREQGLTKTATDFKDWLLQTAAEYDGAK